VQQVTFIKSSGVGGPLALDTPIPTATGWTTMGEITEGATLFDESGTPCRVTYVSPVFEGRRCYEVEFSDGAVITCDDEHRWTVDDKFPGHLGKQHGKRRQSVTKTTAEIAATFLDKGRRRYAIPVCGALDLPDADLPIHPYVLGYWLANGNRGANQLTAHDDDAQEIAGHLIAAGQPAVPRKIPSSKGKATNILLVKPRNDEGKCLRGHRLEDVGTFVTREGIVCCSECRRQHAMHHKYQKPRAPRRLGCWSKNRSPRSTCAPRSDSARSCCRG
jgi:hypothetical protein